MYQINSQVKIFEIEAPDTWLDPFLKILNKHLDSEFLHQLHETNNIYDYLFENQAEILPSIKEQFLLYFTHTKAYHATRVTNISSFLNEGLKPLSIQESNKNIIDFFNNHTTSQPRISDIINELNLFTKAGNDKTRQNLVYLQLYRDELLNNSTQYLLYGSERVFSIIIQAKQYNYIKLLTQIGTPTIFHVAVPTKHIHNLDSILLKIITIVVNYQINSKLPHLDDISIQVKNTIKPSCIIKHESPDIKNLYNPYKFT